MISITNFEKGNPIIKIEINNLRGPGVPAGNVDFNSIELNVNANDILDLAKAIKTLKIV